MAGLPGYKGKITIGPNKVSEMGNWGIEGQEVEMIEDTQFEDVAKSYVPGRLEGGMINYNGHYDPDDTDGQTALATAFAEKTQINNIRLYYGASAAEFFFAETDVTCEVQSLSLEVDQSGIGTIGFTLKVSGNLMKKAENVFDGTITFTNSNSRITRTGGTSFVTLGFSGLDTLTVRGSTDNDGEYIIQSVSSTYIVVDESVTDEGPTADVELISVS